MGNVKSAESKIENQISDVLKREGIDFYKNINVGGTITDFYFSTPTSGSVILEVKNWEPTESNLYRGKIISQAIKNVSKVNQVYVVIPNYESQYQFEGIIPVNQIANVITAPYLNNKRQIKTPEIQKFHPKLTAFVAMPFSPNYEDTYFRAIKPVCTSLKIECIRIDQEEYSGDIKQRIVHNISITNVIIADISESKPNVIYELGYAEGKEKPSIQICSTPVQDIPFNINHDNTILYEIGRTHVLNGKLRKRLKAILKL